jgi:hypothetical protein
MSVTLETVANATVYEIRYSLDGGKSWVCVSHPGTSVTLNNLAAGTSYLLQVRAVTAAGKTDWSESFVAETDETLETDAAAAKPKKAAVIKKNGDKPTITTVTLSVTKDTRNAASVNTASYIVTCISDPMMKFSYSVTGDKVKIEGLKAGTKYIFAVQAVNSFGHVSVAANIKAATAKYNAVKGFKMGKNSNDPNAFTLQWNQSGYMPETNRIVITATPAGGAEVMLTFTKGAAGAWSLDAASIAAGFSATDVLKAGVVGKTNIFSVTLGGLEANKKYKFSMQCFDTTLPATVTSGTSKWLGVKDNWLGQSAIAKTSAKTA